MSDKNYEVTVGTRIELFDPFYTGRGGWPYRYGRILSIKGGGLYDVGLSVSNGEMRFQCHRSEFVIGRHGEAREGRGEQ